MTRLNRATGRRTGVPAPTLAAQRMARLVREITREDQRLTVPLLDAALAGLILGFRPHDREMREQAARAWGVIKPVLARHLGSEEDTLLPWARSIAAFPRAALHGIEKQHAELRALAAAIGSMSFRTSDDAEVSEAGKALCMFAIKLNDLVRSEEKRLLPALRRFVVVRSAGARAEETAGC